MLNFRGRGGRGDSRFQYHAMRGRFGGRRGGGNDFGGFGGGGFDGDDFGGGGGRFGGGPFGGRGGRRRMFDAAELRLVLLKLINDEPRHGYDLIKAIDDLTGGAYAPSPGVVYPTLTLLQDMGQIVEKESDGNKRLFGITEAGSAAVAEQQATVDGLIARLSSLGEESSENDRSPVRRAMFNLHMALKARMFARGRTPELAHEIAAILDEATRKIERL